MAADRSSTAPSPAGAGLRNNRLPSTRHYTPPKKQTISDLAPAARVSAVRRRLDMVSDDLRAKEEEFRAQDEIEYIRTQYESQ